MGVDEDAVAETLKAYTDRPHVWLSARTIHAYRPDGTKVPPRAVRRSLARLVERGRVELEEHVLGAIVHWVGGPG